jgi:hypothetical protein
VHCNGCHAKERSIKRGRHGEEEMARARMGDYMYEGDEDAHQS